MNIKSAFPRFPPFLIHTLPTHLIFPIYIPHLTLIYPLTPPNIDLSRPASQPNPTQPSTHLPRLTLMLTLMVESVP